MARVLLDYVRTGTRGAPVILLGSSLATTEAMWDPFLTRLAGTYDIVRYNYPGHGGSPLEAGGPDIAESGAALVALLDDLGCGPVDYAGVSLGGIMGMWLSAHAPAYVRRLACICTSAYLPPPDRWHDRANVVRRAGTVDVIAESIMQRWFTPTYRATNADEMARVHAMLTACSPEAYASACELLAGMDLRPALSQIVAPTLVIGASEDTGTPPADSVDIATAIAGARLKIIRGAAHLAVIERAGEVAQLVEDHFGWHDRATAPPGIPPDRRSGIEACASGRAGFASSPEDAGTTNQRQSQGGTHG